MYSYKLLQSEDVNFEIKSSSLPSELHDFSTLVQFECNISDLCSQILSIRL